MDLIDILRTAFGEDGHIDDDEIMFFCPRHDHHKRKLCINLKSQKCHCWVCDLSAGSVFSLFKKLNFDISLLKDARYHVEETFDDFYAQQKKPIERVRLPQEFIPLCYTQKSVFYEQALSYLRSRNIEDIQILRNKIGYCECGDYRGRIIFPSFDSKGKLNYFVARWFLDSKNLKYKNPSSEKYSIIFNELYIDFSKPLTICEGVFDSFVCGKNSIPLLGSSLYDNLIKKCVMNSCPKIFLALDPDTYKFDDYENSKLIRICKQLLQYGLNIKFIDIRPHKDAGKMSNNEYFLAKKKAITVNDRFLFNAKMGEM